MSADDTTEDAQDGGTDQAEGTDAEDQDERDDAEDTDAGRSEDTSSDSDDSGDSGDDDADDAGAEASDGSDDSGDSDDRTGNDEKRLSADDIDEAHMPSDYHEAVAQRPVEVKLPETPDLSEDAEKSGERSGDDGG
jgi:hypothetical protein